MSYFTDVFIPSRTRVFQKLFSKHQWMLGLRKLILGGTIRFGVIFETKNGVEQYTIKEGPDGFLTIDNHSRPIDFRVFKIPVPLILSVDEEFLRGWVEKEEKMMKRPLGYIFYYLLRTLPKIKLKL